MSTAARGIRRRISPRERGPNVPAMMQGSPNESSVLGDAAINDGRIQNGTEART